MKSLTPLFASPIILKHPLWIVIFSLALIFQLSISVAALDHDINFTIHKHQAEEDGPTILIIGGIQGDEPGGFHAASLLVTHYQVLKGNLWIVPNLNFISIIKRSRGIYGDMNRKFDYVSQSDPEFYAVNRIKDLIADEQVDFVFNLHDGSGFYQPEYQDEQRGPHRWGQSLIIDQNQVENARYGYLESYANNAISKVNRQHLLDNGHRYYLKNTETRKGDPEMEQTLTYFAINKGKGAMAVESSKNLPTHKRVYYQLRLLEALLKELGVEVQRSFELNLTDLKYTIDKQIQISISQRLILELSGARDRINYLPMEAVGAQSISPNNPLVAVVPDKGRYKVSYGNRRMTTIYPQIFDYDHSLESLIIEIDGEERTVPIGTIVEVKNEFQISPKKGYRVNVIGWKRKGVDNESGVPISRTQIPKRFSIDEYGTTFRVEIYKGDKFSGMVLVRYPHKG